MADRKHATPKKRLRTSVGASQSASRLAILPLGTMLLAGSITGMAQQAAPMAAKTLPTVTVTDKAEAPEGKDALRATTTTIGKGTQQLRDIPQGVTVVTEKLIDDRNLYTLRDALHNTAGVTFQAAEGGEEDIRLRGFSLSGSGDIFIDGMRDAAFYDRDTFDFDRVELLRGSASMLFGHGSTGGLVNQVSKQARALDTYELTTTVGNRDFLRLEGDFNIKTGEAAGLRINAMVNKADNDGTGASIDKRGIALNYRWGIGDRDEFSASLFSLDNNNGINYGLPWIRPTSASPITTSQIIPGLKATAYYGLDTDQNNGNATYATFLNIHRFDGGGELKTQIRKGSYERDLRSGTVRFASNTTGINNLSPNTLLNRGAQNKIQNLDSIFLQSDYSAKFDGLGVKHELLTGMDLAWEEKKGYTLSGIPAGLGKPQTTIGTPDDGAAWNDPRIKSQNSGFNARNTGLYVQDLVQVTPFWKVLAGLRYDRFSGDFDQLNAAGGVTATANASHGLWSKRAGVLYQPDDLSTYYFSAGTSFNTAADTYSYAQGGTVVNGLTAAQRNANTDPEGSRNFELGAKLDWADKRFTTRVALFRTIKTNERNTDVDLGGDAFLLTGKRHSQGIEVDITGRLTPQWEVYGSYAWVPNAKVDKTGTANLNNPLLGPGSNAFLSPRHSGTVWNTYQLTPELRMGGGINFRAKQRPNNNAFDVPSFVTLDLMAEYVVNERFTLKANLNNVTNKYYADVLYQGHYLPGPARTLQVSLVTKF
jgi:catecholate siderophore receptor